MQPARDNRRATDLACICRISSQRPARKSSVESHDATLCPTTRHALDVGQAPGGYGADIRRCSRPQGRQAEFVRSMGIARQSSLRRRRASLLQSARNSPIDRSAPRRHERQPERVLHRAMLESRPCDLAALMPTCPPACLPISQSADQPARHGTARHGTAQHGTAWAAGLLACTLAGTCARARARAKPRLVHITVLARRGGHGLPAGSRIEAIHLRDDVAGGRGTRAVGQRDGPA